MFSTRTYGKYPDAGNDWGQEEKGLLEDEMVGWHHQLNGHAFEQTLGDHEGQGSLAGCSSWGHRVRHDWATRKCFLQSMILSYGSKYPVTSGHTAPPPAPRHLTGFKTKVIAFPWNQCNHGSLVAWTRSSRVPPVYPTLHFPVLPHPLGWKPRHSHSTPHPPAFPPSLDGPWIPAATPGCTLCLLIQKSGSCTHHSLTAWRAPLFLERREDKEQGTWFLPSWGLQSGSGEAVNVERNS